MSRSITRITRLCTVALNLAKKLRFYGFCWRRGMVLLLRSHPYGAGLPDKLDLKQIAYTLVRTQQTRVPKNTLRTPQLYHYVRSRTLELVTDATVWIRCTPVYVRRSLTTTMPTFCLTHSIAQNSSLKAEEEWKATCDSVARFIGEHAVCCTTAGVH